MMPLARLKIEGPVNADPVSVVAGHHEEKSRREPFMVPELDAPCFIGKIILFALVDYSHAGENRVSPHQDLDGPALPEGQ
ncbi:MAG: hypothetical protein E4G96_10880 [Chrysiogenales bacterium]|nr:MAG: hypothetical protein E4G96_10880 [Chrysiogenales bacterium]